MPFIGSVYKLSPYQQLFLEGLHFDQLRGSIRRGDKFGSYLPCQSRTSSWVGQIDDIQKCEEGPLGFIVGEVEADEKIDILFGRVFAVQLYDPVFDEIPAPLPGPAEDRIYFL